MESIRFVFWIGLATGGIWMLIMALSAGLRDQPTDGSAEPIWFLTGIGVVVIEVIGTTVMAGWIALATLLGSIFLGISAVVVAAIVWVLVEHLIRHPGRDSCIPT